MGVLFASKEGPLIMLKSMIVIAFIVVAAVALPSFNDEVVPEEELVGATCTCCGKTVSKPSCSITLYQHCNYGGYGINLAPGSYNMNTLIAKGMKNDDLSSVRIHGSCRAILYQHINFGGASMTKDSDDSCFTNDRMAIPVSQLHQLVVTERPKMPEDEEDEVDEVDTNGRRLLGRRAVSWNDQISSAKVQDRQAAAHSCTAVCKAPCAQEKAEKAAAAEKAAKAAEKKKKAEEKASKEAAAKKEKSEKEKASKEKAAKKKEKDAKEKAAKAKAEKDKKEKDAKKEAAEKAAEKAKKKEMGEKAKEKAAKAAEKKAKAADKKKKEQAEKETAAKKAAAEKEKAAKASEKAEKKKEKEQKATKEKEDKAAAAAEKKSKIPPADPCKKYKAQEAANKKLTKPLQKSIRFEPNQTILTAAGKKTLDDVAAVVIKYAWMELDLTGQSTASGSGCQRLVDGRAKAASAYLKNKGCTNKMNTAGKCKTFIGLTIQATGSAKAPKGC